MTARVTIPASMSDAIAPSTDAGSIGVRRSNAARRINAPLQPDEASKIARKMHIAVGSSVIMLWLSAKARLNARIAHCDGKLLRPRLSQLANAQSAAQTSGACAPLPSGRTLQRSTVSESSPHSKSVFESRSKTTLRRGDTIRQMKKKKRRKKRTPLDEGAYVCPTCGEEIVIPLDPSAGVEQRYVEDCPVCCNPNIVQLEFFPDGDSPRVWADAE